MTRTKAARSSGNCSTPKTSTKDEHILTDYERGTRYAAWLMFGMFAFMAAWMWLAW